MVGQPQIETLDDPSNQLGFVPSREFPILGTSLEVSFENTVPPQMDSIDEEVQDNNVQSILQSTLSTPAFESLEMEQDVLDIPTQVLQGSALFQLVPIQESDYQFSYPIDEDNYFENGLFQSATPFGLDQVGPPIEESVVENVARIPSSQSPILEDISSDDIHDHQLFEIPHEEEFAPPIFENLSRNENSDRLLSENLLSVRQNNFENILGIPEPETIADDFLLSPSDEINPIVEDFGLDVIQDTQLQQVLDEEEFDTPMFENLALSDVVDRQLAENFLYQDSFSSIFGSPIVEPRSEDSSFISPSDELATTLSDDHFSVPDQDQQSSPTIENYPSTLPFAELQTFQPPQQSLIKASNSPLDFQRAPTQEISSFTTINVFDDSLDLNEFNDSIDFNEQQLNSNEVEPGLEPVIVPSTSTLTPIPTLSVSPLSEDPVIVPRSIFIDSSLHTAPVDECIFSSESLQFLDNIAIFTQLLDNLTEIQNVMNLLVQLPVTILVPNDFGFEQFFIEKGITIDVLLHDLDFTLSTIIFPSVVVNGAFTKTHFDRGLTMQTLLEGISMSAVPKEGGHILVGHNGQETITTHTDVQICQALFHVIDTVHFPEVQVIIEQQSVRR
eukprot:TRINITY_DN7451_c0_g1_i9.p1 TRINITY_DN7451_c0_g1~~TRINITY_DN7451_c0_g1_i9.p1  ORF type:complete len:668 (+),score=90.64 TRINITY_DN7451_c0_g1_i9:161-2005(+)